MEIAIAESLKLQERHDFNDFFGGDDDNNEYDEDIFTFDEEDDEKENEDDKGDNDNSNGDNDNTHSNQSGKKTDDDEEEKEEEKKPEKVETVHVNLKRKAEDSGELGQYQFKIRDLEGKSMNARFASSDSVQDIRDYVNANMRPKAPYKIYLSYPKRLLDDNAQISDLNLPIKAVLVLQRT